MEREAGSPYPPSGSKTNMARRGGAHDSEKEEPQKLSYLQPEILPVQVMIDVLKERGIKPAVLQQADRTKIVHLFHKYISPKYQRDCRDNRHGRLLNKARERQTGTLKDEDWKTLVAESKNKTSLGLSGKMVPNNDGERLKPPPACINTERKTIKLVGTTKKASSTDLDLLIIKKRSSEDNGAEASNKKGKFLEEEKSISPEPEADAKEIKFDDHKRKAAHLNSMENCKKSKLDRKPITWP